jgi:signal transduction histidine kinase
MASLGIEAAFLTAIFGALAIPALITGELGSFALSGIVASVVVLLLIDPARDRIEDWVTRRIFQEKARFTAEIAPLLRDLGRNIEPAAMAGRLLTSLERTDRATHAAVYAVDESGGRLTRIGKIGPVGTLSPDDPAVRPVLARLTAGEVLLTDVVETKLRERELRGRGDAAELGALLMALHGLEIGVAVPFVLDGQLLGFLSVRDERRREAYSREEIELLRQVAAQATLVIENSRLYERVKQRDRLAALGEMSAGLAHEIRNPLGAIKGAAQLVITSPDLPSAQEFLQIIVEEVDRLGAVVGEFLDYARPLRISPQPVDLGQVMKRSVALLGDLARGIEIELDLDDDLPNVPGDPELLTQVFLNLAQNACQAMNGAGRLGLSASLAENASLVVCRVEDTGPGIPPEVLGNLFVPFFTTKEKGTGLGLAISQRIIERHSGVISARSLPGQGAAFVVRLPTRQSAA